MAQEIFGEAGVILVAQATLIYLSVQYLNLLARTDRLFD